MVNVVDGYVFVCYTFSVLEKRFIFFSIYLHSTTAKVVYLLLSKIPCKINNDNIEFSQANIIECGHVVLISYFGSFLLSILFTIFVDLPL